MTIKDEFAKAGKYVIAYQGRHEIQYWSAGDHWLKRPTDPKSFDLPEAACAVAKEVAAKQPVRKLAHFIILNLEDDDYRLPVWGKESISEKEEESPFQQTIDVLRDARLDRELFQAAVGYLVKGLKKQEEVEAAVKEADQASAEDLLHVAELLDPAAVDPVAFYDLLHQSRQERRKQKDLLELLTAFRAAFNVQVFMDELDKKGQLAPEKRRYRFRNTEIRKQVWQRVITNSDLVRAKPNEDRL